MHVYVYNILMSLFLLISVWKNAQPIQRKYSHSISPGPEPLCLHPPLWPRKGMNAFMRRHQVLASPQIVFKETLCTSLRKLFI